MGTIADVRAGVQTVLADALQGVTVHRFPADNVDGPTIMVAGFRIDAGSFGDDTVRFEAELYVIVSRRHIDQMELLDTLLSPGSGFSIWDAIDDNPTLGATVAFCSVESAGEYRQMMIGEVPYFAATVVLRGMI